MKLLTHVLLPLLVFPFLTLTAFHLIVHQSLFQNGLQFKISAICEPDLDPHPYRLPYTSITNVDTLLCGMVVFFHALIDTASTAYLAVLFPALSIVALIPFLEAARDRHPFALRMPTAIGVLIQLASAGVIMPLYSLLFVITHTASLRPSTTPTPSPPSKINQGNAEALLFGLILGYIVPTILMLSFARPTVTAAWQGFPLLIALVILVHKIIRPPSRLVQSGHPTVIVTLAFSFVLSALLHVVYVWPVLTDTPTLQTLFVSLMDVSDPAVMSLADGVLEFIKWDFIFGVGSVVIATFWMADSLFSLAGIIVWYGIANIAVGPAAAIAGVLLWRERRLNGKSQVEKVPQKME
ncbi:hypothetical protein L210DRAFT_924027 [Boletus edulis BED1]|uniref:Uncharacterized protein n=1 Tax=Boletus edulis BED1 TaxID=1328754 RepID=A0AAD4BJI9_BOLED|nr:hypothetical protein L210DRAFT_924027 [Boletus edulis BED1]